MNKHIWIAASNQEMYTLLLCLTSLQAVLRKDDGESIRLDPNGFDHLPHTVHAYFGEMDIELHTTRFGVGDDGKPVCYPGWIAGSDALKEPFCALMSAVQDAASFCYQTEDQLHSVFVFPDAAFFVKNGSISFPQ